MLFTVTPTYEQLLQPFQDAHSSQGYSCTQVPPTGPSAGETPHEHVLQRPTLMHVREERERLKMYRARCQSVRHAFHCETCKTVSGGFPGSKGKFSSLTNTLDARRYSAPASFFVSDGKHTK